MFFVNMLHIRLIFLQVNSLPVDLPSVGDSGSSSIANRTLVLVAPRLNALLLVEYIGCNLGSLAAHSLLGNDVGNGVAGVVDI